MALDAAPRARSRTSTDEQQLGQYHYPSIIQAADGTLHATYSFFAPPASVTPDAEKRLPRKSIKHAHFNEAWVKEQQGTERRSSDPEFRRRRTRNRPELELW